LNKGIIRQVRVSPANPVDLLHLTRRQVFVWVEAPTSFEKSLAAENLMQPGNTSGKRVTYVEQRRIGIRQLVGKG
jgi:hypothetical protein